MATTRKGHHLGASPSPFNPNYYGYPAHLIKRAGDFPRRGVLTGKIGPTKNQGNQGSCTGHGSTSQGERLYRRWKDQEPIFSPAFHYFLERKKEGTLADGDCGANVVTSLEIAENGGYGFCPEEFMPYNDADYNTAPSDQAFAEALKYPGGSWHSVGNNIANIKSCILSDYSFVVGIAIYASFEDDHVEKSGMVPVPNPDSSLDRLEGYHEVHGGIAFDDTIVCPNAKISGAVLFQNSWGQNWGTTCPLSEGRGFFWLSYEFLMNPNFTTDVRMQHLGKPW